MGNTLTVCGCYSVHDVKLFARQWASGRLSEANRDMADRASDLRATFSEVELPYVRPQSGHTHAVAAARRSSASAFVDVLGKYEAARPVFLQMSKTDQRKGRAGTRDYHWSKDSNAKAQKCDLEPTDILAMIDVDYYVDMPRMLMLNKHPLVLYTFQPSVAAKSDGDYQYLFHEDGSVQFYVGGGADYGHHVWNYTGDSVAATGYLCGLVPWRHATYSVERKRVDDDHQVVLLAPTTYTVGLMAVAAKYCLDARPLQRLSPVQDGFVRLSTRSNKDIMVSTARAGAFYAATVKVEVDEAIALAAATTSVLTHATVKSKMLAAGADLGTSGSEVLLAYHLVRSGKVKLGQVTSPERVSTVDGVISYQYLPEVGDADYEAGRPSMVAFMNAIVDGAFVPDRSKNNDERTVKKRVVELQAKQAKRVPVEARLAQFTTTVIDEFVDIMVSYLPKDADGKPIRLLPVDYETVYEKQNRPTQRRILEEAQHTHDDGTATAMQKAEAYQTANDPRNITVMNGSSKMEHSKWMYSLYQFMAFIPWYAFGRLPKEVAETVALLCLTALWWLDGDFVRQDGNISKEARYLERTLMRRLFDPACWEELKQCLRSQTFLHVKTKFGVKYNSMFSRASGSAETAVFNTILTAFIAFLAFRMTMKPSGGYYTAQEAWEALGIYGGDDGGTPNLKKEKAEKAATMMGQVLDCTVIARGEPGVQFLARHYGPGVWHGETNSCCDIRRQLSKFHVTVHLNGVSKVGKLLEKAFAFSLSDSETPVIGPFVKKVLALYAAEHQEEYEYKNVLNIWNTHVAKDVHYPNTYADWMDELLDRQFAGGCKLSDFTEWLDGVEDLFGCLTPPCIYSVERDATIIKPGSAVVAGEILRRESGRTTSDDPPQQKRGIAGTSRSDRKRMVSGRRTARQESAPGGRSRSQQNSSNRNGERA